MSGKRKTLTPMDREARRQRWQAAAIERRKIRLSEDPEFRAEHRRQSRDYFRQKYGVDPSSFRDCRSKLDSLDDLGQVREVEGESFLTFTINELAEVLGGYHPQIMRRWISKGQIPAPVLEVEATTTAGHPYKTEAYVEAEVVAIMQHLGEHQSNNAYFRASHKDTIEHIRIAVEHVRQTFGLE